MKLHIFFWMQSHDKGWGGGGRLVVPVGDLFKHMLDECMARLMVGEGGQDQPTGTQWTHIPCWYTCTVLQHGHGLTSHG